MKEIIKKIFNLEDLNMLPILNFVKKSLLIIFSYVGSIIFINFIFSGFDIKIIWEFLYLYTQRDTSDLFFIFNLLFLILMPALIEIRLSKYFKKIYKFILVPLVGVCLVLASSVILIGLETSDSTGLATGFFAVIAIFYHLIFSAIINFYSYSKMKKLAGDKNTNQFIAENKMNLVNNLTFSNQNIKKFPHYIVGLLILFIIFIVRLYLKEENEFSYYLFRPLKQGVDDWIVRVYIFGLIIPGLLEIFYIRNSKKFKILTLFFSVISLFFVTLLGTSGGTEMIGLGAAVMFELTLPVHFIFSLLCLSFPWFTRWRTSKAMSQ